MLRLVTYRVKGGNMRRSMSICILTLLILLSFITGCTTREVHDDISHDHSHEDLLSEIRSINLKQQEIIESINALKESQVNAQEDINNIKLNNQQITGLEKEIELINNQIINLSSGETETKKFTVYDPTNLDLNMVLDGLHVKDVEIFDNGEIVKFEGQVTLDCKLMFNEGGDSHLFLIAIDQEELKGKLPITKRQQEYFKRYMWLTIAVDNEEELIEMLDAKYDALQERRESIRFRAILKDYTYAFVDGTCVKSRIIIQEILEYKK